jgi:hypothetical protein
VEHKSEIVHLAQLEAAILLIGFRVNSFWLMLGRALIGVRAHAVSYYGMKHEDP